MEKEKSNDISVVLAVYNGELYVEKAVQSVLDQTSPIKELIVVNDCSTDGTRAILEKLAENNSEIIIVNNSENLGLTKSLNIALSLAKGEYIARQDADDVSLPGRFESQLKFAEKYKAEFSVAQHLENGKVAKPFFWRQWITLRDFRYGNFICHGTFFIRKDAISKLGGYDESFHVSQDLALMLKYCMGGGKILFLKKAVYSFIKNDKSISALKADKQREARERAMQMAKLSTDNLKHLRWVKILRRFLNF